MTKNEILCRLSAIIRVWDEDPPFNHACDGEACLLDAYYQAHDLRDDLERELRTFPEVKS
jgi:hypothetical protein